MNIFASLREECGVFEEGVRGCFLVAALIGCSFKIQGRRKGTGCRVRTKVRS